MTDTKTTVPTKSSMARMIPVMCCFFAMGFVDLVGIASNYVKQDLALSDSMANLFPSLVFFWFLIFSVPTGLLMNRIGRKRTVWVSLVITLASLLIPLLGNSFGIMLTAFSLLGIGNAVMQTSLNPLVSNLIAPSKLASTLTFGQFVKAIASFIAPIIVSWGATTFMPTFGLGWRILFPIFAAACILSILILEATPIEEERPDKASSLIDCFKLLGQPFILLCFLGIMCHVGIDVGTNTTAPKILIERLSITLEEATIATSVYFIFRTIGCFSGSIILNKVSAQVFLGVSALMMLAGMLLLLSSATLPLIYTGIALIGYGNSNVFPIVFAQAINSTEQQKNEVSGLMIMGLFGGTIFPLAMGFVSDAVTAQWGAVAVMIIGVLYLMFYNMKMKKI